MSKKNLKILIPSLMAVFALGAWIALPFFTEEKQEAPVPMLPVLTESPPPEEEKLPVEEEETPEVEILEEEQYTSLKLNYLEEHGSFELPLLGASAYASVLLSLRENPNGTLLEQIPNGEGFVILEDFGEWWRVDYQGTEGFVFSNYCLLNLPDVLPSAVYLNTNASSSVFHSSNYPLANVTGEQLYEAYGYNQRLDKEEYTAVVLYQTALKIAEVQQKCMKNGETLIINETYRPAEVQSLIVTEMTALSKSNPEVMEGITKPPWSLTWFINTGVSNHQRGYAIDASLGKVLTVEERVTGDYIYPLVTEYQEFAMPSPIHELSYISACKELVTKVLEESLTETLSSVLSSTRSTLLSSQEEVPQVWEETGVPPVAPPSEAPPNLEEGIEPPKENLEEEQVPMPEEEQAPVPEEEQVPVPEEEQVPVPEEEQVPVPEEEPVPVPEEEQLPVPEEVESESVEPEVSSPQTVTSWQRASTMTAAADRLQSYFVAVGMSPIASEWWHFNDFDSRGSNENVGKYYIVGLYSRQPFVENVKNTLELDTHQ